MRHLLILLPWLYLVGYTWVWYHRRKKEEEYARFMISFTQASKEFQKVANAIGIAFIPAMRNAVIAATKIAEAMQKVNNIVGDKHEEAPQA